MTRPTELPRAGGVRHLRDAEVPDFLDAARAAVLAFVDLDDPACQRHRARLELVAAKNDVPAALLDIRTDRLVADALGVRGVPTTIVFVNGEVADRLMGAPPESVLDETLRGRLRTDAPGRP